MSPVFRSFRLSRRTAVSGAVLGLAVLAAGCAPSVGSSPTPSGDTGGSSGRTGTGGSPPGGTGGRTGGGTAATGGNAAGAGGKTDGGTPLTGDAGDPPVGTTADYKPPKVVITELMYHPLLEVGANEPHEFLEIANRSDTAVDLTGWKLVGDIQFAFGKTTLAPKNHLVVARDMAATITVWKVDAATVVGPYTGQLNNSGGRITVLDAAGGVVEDFKYSDKAPWPMGGDALGAGEAWLKAPSVPFKSHQFKGRSIERLSYEVSPQEPSNWIASLLDGATPGKESASLGKVLPVVEQTLTVAKADPTKTTFVAADSVVVRAVFSARGTINAPQVEYFIDDVDKEGEPTTKVMMTKGPDGWEATLPPAADNSIVRYRIVGDRGAGVGQIGPRDSDPYGWYAYFVGPTIAGKTPAYRLFISKAKWTQLFDNVKAGRVPGAPAMCAVNPSWGNRVAAVLVAKGRVYDVMARYQGSPYNRIKGPDVANFPLALRPTAPSPLKALSWHFSFAKYAPMDGKRRDLLLNKRAWECSFLTTGVGGKIFEQLGIPSAQVNLGRLYINGSYIHYFADIEHVDGDMLQRFFGKDHQVGDLFKAVGYNQNQGPYTWSDGRELVAGCGYTAEKRYTYNYDRTEPSWKTESTEAMQLIKDLNVARKGGLPAMKKFFVDNFDVKLMMNYVAAQNWMGPHDDFFQNFYLYKRASDSKWMIVPWDFDEFFGGIDGMLTPASSFWIGEEGNRSNRIVPDPFPPAGTKAQDVKWNNFLKDAFIKAYRDELKARWKELAANELAPDKVSKAIDDMLRLYDQGEAKTSGTALACDPTPFVNRMKTFTTARNANVAANKFD